MISCTYATLLLLHLHVLCCLALASSPSPSALALAQPPQHPDTRCPTTCKKLHIEYPFGAVPGCGAPGFQLDCNASGDHPAWILPGRADLRQYVVVDILKNEHANGSFVVRDAGMSSCTDVHPAANLAHLQLSLASLTFAEFHVPNGVDVLVFNCSVKLTRPPMNALGGRFNYSPPACKGFLQKCGQNLGQYMKPTCFLTHSIDEDFSLLTSMYSCSSYTSFYNVPSPLPDSFPAGIQDGAQLQWSNPLNANACQKCMRSNGECGYVADDDRSFRCLCSGGKSSSTSCLAPGCSGFHCRSKRALGIGLLLIGVVLLATLICAILRMRKRRMHSSSVLDGFNMDGLAEKPFEFSYKALAIATNFFSLKLGEGAFGVVYKGVLRNGDSIAVKVLDGSRQGDKQFANEVATIGSLHHINLVKLVGFCSENSNRILVYEYIVNGSLDKHLFTESEDSLLDWNRRHSIALSTARGLAYLHGDCRKRIIHCDIKPQNILLEGDFNAKIADFGLARLMNRDESRALTTVRGTPGYIAPEFWSLRDGPLTEKCDVYSFGMLLLEMIGGRRNLDLKVSISQLYFPEWVFKQVGKEDHVLRVVDKRIACVGADREQARRMIAVALWCIQEEASMRPSMRRVVQYLEGSLEVPLEPPFPFNSSKNIAVTAAGNNHSLTRRSSSF